MNKKSNSKLKYKIAIILVVSLILPAINVLADEPPIITNVEYTALHVGTPATFFIICDINQGTYPVMEGRINFTGPGYDINVTLLYDSFYGYYHYDGGILNAGTYEFYIWAVDWLGNWARSDNYTILVLDEYLDVVYVDDDAAPGGNGTIDHPFNKISHGIKALNTTGTMYINNGFYQEPNKHLINKKATIIGESKENVIIDGSIIINNQPIFEFQMDNISISNCTIANNSGSGYGIKAHSTIHNTIINCDVYNVYYGTYTNNANIMNCNFYNNSRGLHAGSNSIITNCSIYNSNTGIVTGLYSEVINCSIYNNVKGIDLITGSGHYNTIMNCEITNNTEYGIFAPGPTNDILGCDIHDQPKGIIIGNSNNKIQNNDISNHSESGIMLISDNSENNLIYHNNFINNFNHVIIEDDVENIWDDGTTGNYWDDYEDLYPNATIDPVNFTWNTPYVLNESNIDNHPWVFPNGARDEILPEVTVVYPNGGETLTDEVLIEWTATDDFTDDLNGTINIEYSDDAGANWYEIASGLDNTGSILWNTTGLADGNDYLIQVSATDEFLNTGSDESDDVFSIDNLDPEIQIGDIIGGFFEVSSEIINTGEIEILDVDWSISVTGGIFNLINSTFETTISILEPGESEIGIVTPIFGLGLIEIEILANSSEIGQIAKTAKALVIGPLVLGIIES